MMTTANSKENFDYNKGYQDGFYKGFEKGSVALREYLKFEQVKYIVVTEEKYKELLEKGKTK